MILISNEKGRINLLIQGDVNDAIFEAVMGASQVLLRFMKDDLKKDPEKLKAEARRFGEFVGEAMIMAASPDGKKNTIVIPLDSEETLN